MISTIRPKDFTPKFDVASCFVELNDEILFLLRLPHKSEGNKWGIPAGKVDPGETPLEAVVRETAEETGLHISTGKMNFFKTYYVRFPDYDFVYHVFQTIVSPNSNVRIKPSEHQDFQWLSPADSLTLELVRYQNQITADFYQL